ncbi:MAG: STAS domain-containing protein [Cyanobacteria bacterium CAN_BIN43]|nr:STAS domain-containing protein [Cyanobacteria bacterium CAN_BIN43]
MTNVLTSSKIKIVTIQKDINAENASELKQFLVDMVSAQETSSVMVDMSKVGALDSTGLMILVSTLTLAQHLNKQFGLFGVSASVRIIFELTQLDRVFDILESQPYPELDLVAA